MKNLKLSIKQKLIFGFLLIGLIVAFAGISSVYFTSKISNTAHDVGIKDAPLADAAMEIKLTATTAHLWFEEIMSGDENEDVQQVWDLLNETLWYCDAIIEGGKNDEGEFVATDNEKIKLKVEDVKLKVKSFTELAHQRYDKLSENSAAGSEIDQKFDKYFDEFIKEADEAEELIHDNMDEGNQNLDKFAENAVNALTFISIFGLILSLIIAILIYRNISGQLNKTVDFAQKVAEGNFDTRLDINQNDEIGKLSKALNEMVLSFSKGVELAKRIAVGNLKKADNIDEKNIKSPLVIAMITMQRKLNEVVSNIMGISDKLTANSLEISSSSSQIASGSNEQAASTEEVSASMEEMVANINQNAEHANDAENIAVKAEGSMKESNESFTITMNALRDIAQKIVIISEIAQKTDVLAINAAIEAARAGEHGKGFAVVASEIRKLAENSQLAAKEIDELVKSSVFVAENSAKQLAELVPDIQQNSVLVQQINASSKEQNIGAEQINNAIQELTKVIQQNTMSSTALSDNSQVMTQQAESLISIVEFFKIENTYTGKIKKQIEHTEVKKTFINTAPISKKSDTQTSIDIEMNDDQFENY